MSKKHHLKADDNIMEFKIHCVFVGLDSHYGDSDKGKLFNVGLLTADVEAITIDTGHIVTVAFVSKSNCEKQKSLNWGGGVVEDYYCFSNAAYHGMVLSFIPSSLLSNMALGLGTSKPTIFETYMQKSKVDHLVFCDFFPFKSESFVKMIDDMRLKSYCGCTESIALLKGLHRFSESDISTEGDSIKDAILFYEKKGWDTTVCNRYITPAAVRNIVMVRNCIRTIRTSSLNSRIASMDASLELLGTFWELGDYSSRVYKSVKDFNENALQNVLNDALEDKKSLFDAICPNWRGLAEQRLSKYEFPMKKVAIINKAFDFVVKDIQDYYEKQINKINTK